jgi:alpha-2-macroglobulin-like protein
VSGQDQGMAVAIVGLPAGLTVPEDLKQLKEHCKIADGKKPLLGAFEIKGRELVLYWRALAKGQAVEVPIDLIARVPGTYRGPASRAYLYYNADHRHWVEPLTATITAK